LNPTRRSQRRLLLVVIIIIVVVITAIDSIGISGGGIAGVIIMSRIDFRLAADRGRHSAAAAGHTTACCWAAKRLQPSA
jgi:hypothetical protein